ncbi:hypothetical protein AAHA92_31634 [Salvia divinorum]|uniref:Uncharacterized protein n=1 Tax=Salvia divinorum TaxID=28513 RepID=A0ABD1FK24_SALDI
MDPCPMTIVGRKFSVAFIISFGSMGRATGYAALSLVSLWISRRKPPPKFRLSPPLIEGVTKEEIPAKVEETN